MKRMLSTLLAAFGLIVPTLRAQGDATTLANWADEAETGWYGDGTAASYTISTAEQLAGLAALVNGTAQKADGTNIPAVSFEGKTITLTADINLADREWTPIGNGVRSGSSYTGNAFKGTFDGNGKIISNLMVTGSKSYVGFFGKTANATLENLTLENVNVSGYQYVGGLSGHAYTGTVENCRVTGDVKISGSYKYVGGITGSSYATFRNCSVEATTAEQGEIFGKSDNVGGLVGYRAEGGLLMDGCSVSNVKVSGVREVGGLAGTGFANNRYVSCSVNKVTVVCTATSVSSYLASSYGYGGLVGTLNNGSGTYKGGKFENCVVEGVTLEIPETLKEQVSAGYVSGGVRDDSDKKNPPRDFSEKENFASNIALSGDNSGANNDYLVPYVAQVGETKYLSLQEAFDAAQTGDTVKLLMDVTEDKGNNVVRYVGGKDFTVDFAGHTLTANTANAGIVVLGGTTSDSTITLKNGTIVAGSPTWCALIVSGDDKAQTSAIVNAESMTFSNCKPYANAIKVFAGATVNLRKVSVSSSNGAGGATAAGGTINIWDSTFDQGGYYDWNSVNVSASNGGVANIYSGTFTAASYGAYVFNSGATINIFGGNFTSGKAVLKADKSITMAPSVVKVSNGTFAGLHQISTGATLELSGGVYTVRPESAYCAEGFVPYPNTDGTYTVDEGTFAVQVGDGEKYATLQEAVDAANGETITLLRDVVLEDTVVLTRDVAIDLAGHTLYAKNGETPAFERGTGANVPDVVTVTFKKPAEGGEVNGSFIAKVPTTDGTVTIDGLTPVEATYWTDKGAYDEKFYADLGNLNWNAAKIDVKVETAAELAALCKFSNEDEALPTSLTVTLTQSVDLRGLYWEPIKEFQATFKGATFKISNLQTKDTVGYGGLFGKLSGTVEQLYLEDVVVAVLAKSGRTPVLFGGTLAGSISGATVKNVAVVGATIAGTLGEVTELPVSNGLGGLAGTGTGTVENCLVSGVTFEVPDNATNVGVFVGASAEGMTVANSLSLSPLSDAEVNGPAFKTVYARDAVEGWSYFSGDGMGLIGKDATLAGFGWVFNGQVTEGEVTWYVDSNAAPTTILPFKTATVQEVPQIAPYFTEGTLEDGTPVAYANDHADVTVTYNGSAKVLQGEHDIYLVPMTLTLADDMVVCPGTADGEIDRAALEIAKDVEAKVWLGTAKTVQLVGSGSVLLVSREIPADQTLHLGTPSGSAITAKVSGGVTLKVAGTVKVEAGSAFIGTDGTSSVDISGSVTGLAQGLSAWDVTASKWVQAQIKTSNGAYYGTVEQALAALTVGDTVTLLSKDVATDLVLATSAEKTFTAGEAYDVAALLGGAFKMTLGENNTKRLVYAYDLGVMGLPFEKNADGTLTINVQVGLQEHGSPVTRTLPEGSKLALLLWHGEVGCYEGHTYLTPETNTGAAQYASFVDGICVVKVPNKDLFLGTNRFTVQVTDGTVIGPSTEIPGTGTEWEDDEWDEDDWD